MYNFSLETTSEIIQEGISAGLKEVIKLDHSSMWIEVWIEGFAEGYVLGRKEARKVVLEDLFKEGLITEEIMKEYLSLKN